MSRDGQVRTSWDESQPAVARRSARRASGDRDGTRRRATGMAAGVLLVVVTAGCTLGDDDDEASPAAGPAVCDTPAVADEVLPSVVTIHVSNGSTAGTGSGTIIRTDGSILTNNHVIADVVAGGRIEVLFSNGSHLPASITGRDPKADLAVIKVTAENELPTIEMGHSTDVVVGAPVIAVGAPLGYSGSVTSGIVSALDRTVEVPGDNGERALLVSAIQTDAAINPGNSGGALVNCAGQLVGVPSAGAVAPSTSGGTSVGSIGLGFAIPVDFAKKISDQLIATGSVTHSYFGVQVVTLPRSAAEKLGTPEGLYVSAVTPGGPAATAGLLAGDVITEVDGEQVTSSNELAAMTLTRPPGDAVRCTYVRGGATATTTITLGAAP